VTTALAEQITSLANWALLHSLLEPLMSRAEEATCAEFIDAFVESVTEPQKCPAFLKYFISPVRFGRVSVSITL
jgi:hypothetical protein